LNPLYTDKEIVFDESLLGVWVGPNNGEDGGLKFSRFVQDSQKGYVQKGYVLTMFDGNKNTEDAEKMVFHAFLVKLGGRQFLDAVLQDNDPEPDSYSLQIKSNQNGTRIEPQLIQVGTASYLEFGTSMPGDNGKFQAQLRPAHWLMKITRNGEKLKLEYADDDDFKKAVQSGSFHLPSAILGEGKNQRVVITPQPKNCRSLCWNTPMIERFSTVRQTSCTASIRLGFQRVKAHAVCLRGSLESGTTGLPSRLRFQTQNRAAIPPMTASPIKVQNSGL
jgi:hypothetical protein